MVMRKLSESVWGDLRKKSLGQEERIQDDITKIKDFYEYLKSIYSTPHDYPFDMFSSDDTGPDNVIEVPILEDIDGSRFSIYIIYNNGSIECVEIGQQFKQRYPEAIENFGDEYDFDFTEGGESFRLTPVNGKPTPQFCMEIIDRIIDNLKFASIKRK